MRWVWLTTMATAVAAAQVAPQAPPSAAVATHVQATAQDAAQASPNATPNLSPADTLAAAQRNAESSARDWLTLAQGLDAQLAPLLPCDPKARKIVQDANKASDARVAALGNYLRLQAVQAAQQTAGARKLREAEEARAPESGDERTDAAVELSTVEAQSANLRSSADARPGLSDARNTLEQVTQIVSRRSQSVNQNAAARDQSGPALRDLATAYQAREAAIKDEIAAFQSEAARWNTYYSVRLARVQAECTAVGGGPVTPAPRSTKGAQKGSTAKGTTKPAGGSPASGNTPLGNTQ